MSVFDELITDRTQTDVDYVFELKQKIKDGWAAGYTDLSMLTDEEKTEYLSEAMKGAYNATDLNRVEEAVTYLGELLSSMGYNRAVNGTKTDWEIADIPSQADMSRYIGNIQGLRAVFGMFPDTPAAPESMDALGYDSANAIEKILLDLYTLAQNIPAEYIYSDEIYSGEDDFV